MEKFVQGQRLTASQLNSAFEKVGGPMNPSNDYQWTKTDYGNLQTTWDTFIQPMNQNPDTLEVGIGYSKIGSETVHEVGGKTPAALRRVFINVGKFMNLQTPGSVFSEVPNIGDVNGIPFLGIVGWEFHSLGDSLYIPGDNKMAFSVWSSQLSKGTTPQQWMNNQKLWQDNVIRGCDSRGWWWTGITLERHEPVSSQMGDEGLDLCCFPMFLHYKKIGSTWSTKTYAILMVMLRRELNALLTIQSGFADDFYKALTEAYPVDDLRVSEISIANASDNTKCLAQYVYSNKTQNAYYKTQLNFAHFDQDTSPFHFATFRPQSTIYDVTTPMTYGPQWIDDNGKHQSFSSTVGIPVVNLDGSPIQPGDTIDHVALACGWNPKGDFAGQPVLSCVSYDNEEIMGTGNPAQAILSGLFNEQEMGLSSETQKRLIWLNTLNARGVQYYDTCPDFRSGGGKINISAWDGHEIDTADNVSNLVLSSRADSRVEWDLVDLSGKWRIDCGVYYV